MYSSTHSNLRVSMGNTIRNLHAFTDLWDTVYANDRDAVRPFFRKIIHSLGDHDPYLRRGKREVFVVMSPRGNPVARAVAWHDPVSGACFDKASGFFSHFESIESTEAVQVLLTAVRNWLLDRGATQVLGPMSPKMTDTWGLLVEGSGRPVYGMPHNPPYYLDLLTSAGLTPVEDLLQLTFTSAAAGYPRLQDLAALTRKRLPELIVRGLRMSEFEREWRAIVEFHNRVFVHNWGFIPIEWDEFWEVAREFRSIYSSDYGMVAELDGRLIGILITIPDVNEVFHRIQGRMWPVGWWHLLTGLRRTRELRGVFAGVEPRYRFAGIEASLLSELAHTTVPRHRIIRSHAAWILNSNSWWHQEISRVIGPENITTQKYRIYQGTTKQ
jgi:hypothetical protein